MAKMLFRLPQAKRVIENPSPEAVKELTAKMPTARPTKFGNLNVQTQVLARSKGSTFLVTDEPDGQNQAISTDDAAKWADRQDEYIAGQEMVVIDGYIGNDPEFRTPTRLYVEAANANIAGMQQQLYFGPPEDDFEPELTVIYTPNLKAEGFPDDRLIMVDLEQGVTRVFNSDYFGESKKGGLRMWNKLVYDRGGLPLHAGCKVIPTDDGDKVCLDGRAFGHGQDDDDVHEAERLAPGAGRLRRVDAGRSRLRDRERLLREDVRAQPGGRADDLRRGHAAGLVPRERLAEGRRGRLLRRELHAERSRDVPVRRDRVRGRPRDRGRPLPARS